MTPRISRLTSDQIAGGQINGTVICIHPNTQVFTDGASSGATLYELIPSCTYVDKTTGKEHRMVSAIRVKFNNELVGVVNDIHLDADNDVCGTIDLFRPLPLQEMGQRMFGVVWEFHGRYDELEMRFVYDYDARYKHDTGNDSYTATIKPRVGLGGW